VGVIFLFLILIIGLAVEATSSDTTFADIRTHVDLGPTPEFPACTGRNDTALCYNLAYASIEGTTGRDDAAIEAVIDALAAKLGIAPERNVPGGIFQFDSTGTFLFLKTRL
jgi:hypothetical protein